MNKVLTILKSKGFIITATVAALVVGTVLIAKKEANELEAAEISE